MLDVKLQGILLFATYFVTNFLCSESEETLVSYHECSCGVPMYPPMDMIIENGKPVDKDSIINKPKPKLNHMESHQPAYAIPDSPDERIVNGAPARMEEFPWLVGLQEGKWYMAAPMCGGSLITDRHVISAAHCLRSDSALKPSSTYALIGAYDWTDRFDVRRSQIVKIQNGVVPETFDGVSTTFVGDVSILELEQPIELNPTAYPICLPPKNLKISDLKDVVVSGWGTLMEQGDQPKLNYKTTRELKVMEYQECNKIPELEDMIREGRAVPLTERHFCAMGNNTDSCQGDSGGPLMFLNRKIMRYHIVGIVSYGWGCNTPGLPGVYTNLLHPAMRNFITCNIYNGVACKT